MTITALAKKITEFRNNQTGSVLASFALLAPLLLGGSLFAATYTHAINTKQKLQNAADSAALAAVRHLRLGAKSDETLEDVLSSISKEVARLHMDVDTGLNAKASRAGDNKIKVELTLQTNDPLFGLVDWGLDEFTAVSVAEAFGSKNVCMIALEEDYQTGINLQQSAAIKAGDCGVYSNSIAQSSIISTDDALVDATFVCSGGGYEGSPQNFTSTVVRDCPPIEDPLSSRPLPTTPPYCDFGATTIMTGYESLSPGHYCGEIIIEGDAEVIMEPGEYFISNGQFHAKGESTLTGEGVAILMESSYGNVQFEENATVNLSAPTEGPLAGIVLASRPLCAGGDCHSRLFNITSPNVTSLLGTIYIPEDRMIINTHMSISEEAAFTIVVARFIQGQQSPTLVLNTDYYATDVPVPDGFIGTDGSRLSQ